jgi:hypothetical protein
MNNFVPRNYLHTMVLHDDFAKILRQIQKQKYREMYKTNITFQNLNSISWLESKKSWEHGQMARILAKKIEKNAPPVIFGQTLLHPVNYWKSGPASQQIHLWMVNGSVKGVEGSRRLW